MAEYGVWIVVHLGLWISMLLAAAGLGHVFLRKYDFDSFAERSVFTLSLGLGLSALIIFALGISNLFYKELFLVLTITGSLATVVYWVRSRRGNLLGLSGRRDLLSLRGAFNLALLGIALAYWGLLLYSALYPPMHWDAISHHLVLCREYLAHHGIIAVMGIPFPVLPALNHMLFTWGMALEDDILAQMMSHTFMMLTAVGLFAWGKRERQPMLGIAAAALWLGCPLVLWLGQSAYVDICQVCFIFLGMYALRIFWDRRERRWWYLAMATLGLAAGVKLPALFFIIVGSALGLVVIVGSRLGWKLFASSALKTGERDQPDFTWKALVGGWLIAFAVLIPWYAFVFYHSGNPIWPTFPQISRGVWGSPEAVEGANSWLRGAGEARTLENFAMLSINWIYHPEIFQAEVGKSLFPLLIAWPLTWVFALWNRSVRWWALWGLSFTVYWFFFPNLLRYWLPALPLAVLALYESIRWILERVSRSVAFHSAVWLVLAFATAVYGARIIHGEIKLKGKPPVTAGQREAFVSMLSGYGAVKYVNKQASAEDTVCVINSSYLNYYLKPQILDLFALLQSGRLPKFHWPEDAPLLAWLESRNVTWIFVNHANVPDYLKLPKQNLVTDPIWPTYDLVYADSAVWVFRRKPVPPEVW